MWSVSGSQEKTKETRKRQDSERKGRRQRKTEMAGVLVGKG